MPVIAVAGPEGVAGVEMLSPAIATASPGETLDRTEGFTVDRACIVTE